MRSSMPSMPGKRARTSRRSLGDLLLQVLFHARLADQDGRFDIAAWPTAWLPSSFAATRMSSARRRRRRMPVRSLRNWEQIKQRGESEPRGRERGPWADIPSALPALLGGLQDAEAGGGARFRGRRGSGPAQPWPERWHRIGRGEHRAAALFWLVALCRASRCRSRRCSPKRAVGVAAILRDFPEWGRELRETHRRSELRSRCGLPL